MLVYMEFFVGSESATAELRTPGMAVTRRTSSWKKASFLASVSYFVRGSEILAVSKFAG
jgi:hypothetical protein